MEYGDGEMVGGDWGGNKVGMEGRRTTTCVLFAWVDWHGCGLGYCVCGGLMYTFFRERIELD